MKDTVSAIDGKKFVCGNGKLVFLSYSAGLFYSTNGTTWTKSTSFTSVVGDFSSGGSCYLSFCNGIFYALDPGSNYVYESFDAVTWARGFSLQSTNARALVHYNYKYYLFFSNAVLYTSDPYSATQNWNILYFDNQVCSTVNDVVVTSDGTFVMIGYSVSNGSSCITFSKDLVHWCPACNPAGAAFLLSAATDGTNVVVSNSYRANLVSVKVAFGGTLSYTLNYPLGLHLLAQYSGSVFASPSNGWRCDASYLNYNGTRLYYNTNSSVETPSVAYVYNGMQKSANSVWGDIASGEFFSFSQLSISYTPIGQNARTVNNVQSISWSQSTLIIVGSAQTVILDGSVFLSALAITFIPVSRAAGNYTKSLFPLDGYCDIGAGSNKYYRVYTQDLYADVVHSSNNDIADAVEVGEEVPVIPGGCYVMTEKGIRLSSRKCETGVLGLHSDTYGFLIGGLTDRKEIHIAVGGFALACTDREYAPGTPLTAGPGGKLTKMSLLMRVLHPERMVGVFHQKELSDSWNGIPVNGRHWIKVR